MRIVNFGQMIDVQSRQMAHQIVVETVDGRQHVITTDEATVQQLVEAMTNNLQAAQVQAMPTQVGDLGAEAARRAGLKTLQDAMARQVRQRRADAGYDAVLTESEGAFWDQVHDASPEEQEYEVGAEIFGGEEDPGEVGREPVMGVIAEDRIADAEEPIGGLGQPKPRPKAAQLEVTPPPRAVVRTDADGFVMPVRSKTVPKDEMGYPIVKQQGRRAPQIPDDNGEEDGSQI